MDNKKILISILILISVFSLADAQEEPSVYISNSGNWQDVYSVMQFSALKGNTGYFLVSTKHSTLLVNQLNTNSNTLIVSSTSNPYVVGYRAVLESRGFNQVDEIRTSNVNLEMARRLEDVSDFIIVDDSYGYNAISVAPYAAVSNSYVIFADRRNINQVYTFLQSVDVDSLIFYGQLDREVKDRLAEYDPEVINEENRFLNNQKIVDKYQGIMVQQEGKPKSQAILTNGEFIEQEIMSGVEPVVFIGRANVPDQVREYIRGSDIDIGILIGNELVGSATFIRRELGISVFVKFAQSARAPTATISPVEDLDRFYLPRYIVDLDIYSVRYNRMTNTIEVTYQNNVDLSAYFKSTITINYEGGTIILGDEESIFIDKSEFKTIIYDTTSEGLPIPNLQGNISAEVFTIFGESENTLEYTLRKTLNVETINILDESRIEFGEVLFDRRSGKFLIEIINTGDVDVFVNAEIIDLIINDELVTLGADEVIFIESGDSKYIEVTTDMDDTDLGDNPTIRVRAYYGQRELSLIYVIEDEFSYGYTGLGYITGQVFKDIGKNIVLYLPLIIIIILLILILGMKKKCPHCGEINNLRSKKCKNCGGAI